ncbi:YlbG family protein [Lacticaseibacillus pabuli]|uniref:UPF0298 protein PQ472_06775 n=1 Tax=Lacticaseibacillus pabuli TaxID=3025672 RepID=A0ABY7WPB5_9LACO|nr:YlbG family protein [Lacticaseibacillus sp. KACC 23028]WDF81634.1 YlbG family protein [Lacticaseibacillus sp. KACC 23028]
MEAIRERRGLIVWLYSMRQLKQLRHYGTIYYASKRMKYVVMYVDQEAVPELKSKLEHLRFVRKVDESARPDLKTSYAKETAEED